MSQTIREVVLVGTIVGRIWMPAAECWKDVRLEERDFRYSNGERPTIRDFALKATNDGDFQACSLTADSIFVFKRIKRTETGSITRTRAVLVTQFKTIQDCLDPRESWGLQTFEDEDDA